MSDYLWGIYRLLHDPPGTPKELKCVGCKVAVAGASLAGGGINFILAKKYFTKNTYRSAVFGGVGTLFIASGLIFLRLGYEHHKYNQQLTKEFGEKARKNRIENKVINH